MSEQTVIAVGWVLGIVGFLCALALTAIAWLLKGIYTKQIDIEIKVTQLFVKEESKEKRVTNLEENEKEVFKRLNKLEQVI